MSEPTVTLERTDSAIKMAEEVMDGNKVTSTSSDTSDSPSSVITKAMEIIQPGSSKKATALKAAEGDEAKEKKSKHKSHRKKNKKDKEKEKEKDQSMFAILLVFDLEIDKTLVSNEEPGIAMQITVKHLEQRYDEQGYQHIQEPGSEPPEKSKEDKWANFILCEMRHFDYEQKYTHRTLEVKSKHLKTVLGKVIGEYPGISFKTVGINLSFPLRCFYHYLDALKAELEAMKAARPEKVSKKEKGKKYEKKDKKKSDGDSGESSKVGAANGDSKEEVKDEKREEEKKQKDAKEAIEHLEFLVTFIENEFQDTIKDYNNLVPHGLITFDM